METPTPESPPPPRRRIDFVPMIVVALFVCLWAAFAWLGVFLPMKQRIAGVDPVGYYAWIHSLAFDHDLQFENEYLMLNGGVYLGPPFPDPNGPRTPTGHLSNPFSLGPGLLWTPFVFAAHVIAKLKGYPADGFSEPYIAAVFVANAVYGLIGTLLLYWGLRTWFTRGASAVAAIAAWAASPLLYYTYAQQAMSHTCSFFAMALLLEVWARLRLRPGYGPWAVVGAALGLATLVRWQNVTFAIIPAIDLLARDPKRNLPRLAVCAVAAVVAFSPQMIVWKIVYGSFVTIPQGSGFMDWRHPHPLLVLFSPSYGLLTWTPLCAIGLVGLFIWPKDNRLPFITLAAAFLVQFYVQSVAGNIGWTFGMRRMDNCVPLLAVGFALFSTRLHVRWGWSALVSGLFIVWNFLFVLQYAGFINQYYVDSAFDEFVRAHGTTRGQVLQTRRLPDGAPFDPRVFAFDHTFPKGGKPTLRQFTLDKGRVIQQIYRHVTKKKV
ncbi:MAG: hypothetical protein HZB26_13870 [Candidatus Hydrogenedentes bacterium]|nr:hypothetical protein [Candidatus Hydrogenedentota bacterium]